MIFSFFDLWFQGLNVVLSAYRAHMARYTCMLQLIKAKYLSSVTEHFHIIEVQVLQQMMNKM